MSPRDKIRALVGRLPPDITTEQLLDKLDLFMRVEIGMAQIDRGECIDHDELFDELEAECDANVKSFDRVKRLQASHGKSWDRLSVKEQVKTLAECLDEKATYDDVMYEVALLSGKPRKSREILARELGVRPDEILDELPSDEKEGKGQMDGAGKLRSSKNKGRNQPPRSANGARLRKTPAPVRKRKA